MSRIETYFLLLVVLNLCITAAYVLWNEQHWRESARRLCFWHR